MGLKRRGKERGKRGNGTQNVSLEIFLRITYEGNPDPQHSAKAGAHCADRRVSPCIQGAPIKKSPRKNAVIQPW